jgi:uncharacterized protein YbbC (DUF1343 family)
MFGHPNFTNFDTVFTPVSVKNASLNPKLKGKECKGYSLIYYNNDTAKYYATINLQWLINSYNDMGKRKDFFNSFFSKLAGTKILRKQIESGMSEKEIKQSWQNDLNIFKAIRKKYLLYTDFE